jgi:translation initiation factor IF-1
MKTKLTELSVVCESCNTLKYAIYINNQNNNKCDICGKIKNKVMYIDKKTGRVKG